MPDTPLFGPDDHVDDVEALLRELTVDDLADVEPVAPPDDLWPSIAARIDAEFGTSPDADVVARSGRRSRRSATRWLAAAAVVAALAVGVVAVVATRDAEAPVVATAELTFDDAEFDPLGAGASATAELLERSDGYEIRLDEASLPTPDGEDLELWLISTDDTGAIADVQPVSLVDPGEPGTYAVPDGLDPSVYSVVDISIEPRDGVTDHSGRSILRGELDV